jgi:hypothetical protein
MLQEVILLPATDDVETVDRFIEKYIVPAHRASPGFRALTINREPLMSPFGRPAYSRVIVVTLNSLDDMMAIGRSELIQRSQSETPDGMQVVFYEYEG